MKKCVKCLAVFFIIAWLSTPVLLAQSTADGEDIIEPGESPQEELAKAAQTRWPI
jgi:hypothetical protein